jgi:DNA-directed RNA polymerase specialized sigma24 family protein
MTTLALSKRMDRFDHPPHDASSAPNPGDDAVPTSSWYVGAARVAFDRLYTAAFAKAVRIARARGFKQDDAEDVASAALNDILEAFNSGTLPADADEATLTAWVEPRVFFRRLDWLKAKRREQEKLARYSNLELSASQPATSTTDPSLERLELRDAAVRAVRELPAAQQELLTMVCDGLGPAQIAEAKGIRGQSAYNAVSRVMMLLRDAAGPEFERMNAERTRWYGSQHEKRSAQ